MSTQRPLIIAEAGVNHNGDLRLAMDLIEAAMEVGADVVKFQSFTTDELVAGSTNLADYQRESGTFTSQADMLRTLELSRENFVALKRHASQIGIEFMSTPFDHGNLNFLVSDLGVARIKIGSGDLTNLPLVAAAGMTGLPVILSTGASTLQEVSIAIGAFSHGALCDGLGSIDPARFPEWKSSATHANVVSDRLTILQCSSAYPSPPSESNILAMTTMGSEFGVRFGFSDHTTTSVSACVATALGACVIEKHLTLDHALPGPDHAASLDPVEFRNFVADVKAAAASLGTGIKEPSSAESANRDIIRRSLVAARDLTPGEVIQHSDLRFIRPGGGTTPYSYWSVLGREVPYRIQSGDPIDSW